VTSALLWTLFLYSGFEEVPVPAGEVRDAREAVPRALFLVLGTATAVYIMVHLVAQGVYSQLSSSMGAPLADAAHAFMGTPGATLIAVGGVISLLGVNASIAFTGPRSMYALARDGSLPRLFARIHPRFHTPHPAIVATALLVILLPLLDSLSIPNLKLENLVRMSALASLMQYIPTTLSVILMRLRKAEPQPGFVIPGGVLVPILAFVLCLILLGLSDPIERNATLLGVALGVPVYLLGRVLRWRTP